MKRVIFLVLLVLPAVAAAQPDRASPSGRDGGWFAIGLGLGAPHGTALVATANFGSERVIQVGLHSSGRYSWVDTGPVLTALHVGAGLSRVDRWSRVALAAGPALILQRTAELEEARAAGVVVNGQAVFTPLPEVGVGLSAYINVNPLDVGYGLGFTLVFERNK